MKAKIYTNGPAYAIIKGWFFLKYAYAPGLKKWYWIYSDDNRGSWALTKELCEKFIDEANNYNRWIKADCVEDHE